MNIVSNMVEVHIFRQTKTGIEFLLLKRSEDEIYPGLWQMVTGSVKDGENAYAAAFRELKEETGLLPVGFWVVPNVNSFYSPDNDSVYLIPVFAALVVDPCKVIISDEHSEYKWLDPDEAKKLLAWTGQRESVDIICNYFLNEKSKLEFVDLTDRIRINV
ncbi:MAG: NUDIX pyrophosphatase [Melioribacteraceae bacterium]|nr:NUDIX pyrophosphatase [Melioribacteraceae bacterium]